jgi:hypothetical protein
MKTQNLYISISFSILVYMDPLKICHLCGCNSNETAIFSCTYAKGQMEVCLECLTEGIFEISKATKTVKNDMKKIPEESIGEPLNIDGFDLTVPDEVFGFNCENCSSIMFSNIFPVSCDGCGHINQDHVLRNQNILNGK